MMKEEQEAKKLPPKYTGKWATASKEEVDAELAKGKRRMCAPCAGARGVTGRNYGVMGGNRGAEGWRPGGAGGAGRGKAGEAQRAEE